MPAGHDGRATLAEKLPISRSVEPTAAVRARSNRASLSDPSAQARMILEGRANLRDLADRVLLDSLRGLPSKPRPRYAFSALAALASLALHALLVTSFLWGDGSTETHPHDAGVLGVATPKAADDGGMQVILLDDPAAMSTKPLADATIPYTPDPISIPVVLQIPDVDVEVTDPGEDVDRSTTSSAASAPDGALRSAMYGRYLGQIDARIERAWLRPRSEIGAPVFRCFVRIDQDAHGNVLGVTLEQCNGTDRWQHSLVSAIDSASPLSAPPDPTVFTHILHLNFQAQPYGPGAHQDEYEPEWLTARDTSISNSQTTLRTLDAFGRALRNPPNDGVISLTLTGSRNPGPPSDSLPVPAAGSSSTPLPPDRSPSRD